VAVGRKLDLTRVDAIARGRVWTGAQAKARGLVDEHGGLLDALELARRRVGLTPDEPVDLVMLPQVRRSLVERLVGLVVEGGEGRAPRAAPAAAESAVPLPAALRDTLRAVPPALLFARPGEGLYRMEFAEAGE
jgi:protease-4